MTHDTEAGVGLCMFAPAHEFDADISVSLPLYGVAKWIIQDPCLLPIKQETEAG